MLLGTDTVVAAPLLLLLLLLFEAACCGGLRAEAFCPEDTGTKPTVLLVLLLATGLLAAGLGLGLFETGLGLGVGLAGPRLRLLEPGLGLFKTGLRLELLDTELTGPDGLATGVADEVTDGRPPAVVPAAAGTRKADPGAGA